ncbi:MAG TPA: hypothetical protein VEZ20_03845 [Allosphingosinicella sp.]|jgi:hypothetical protein|nr:hypothetical protein [Allosphingosinicella sp.]
MESGVYLSQTILANLSDTARAEISMALFPVNVDDDDWETDVAQLTTQQGVDFVAGCSAKSCELLQVLVDNPDGISHRAIRDEFNATAADLKSAFGGLTKRARTVTGKKKAKLIQWTEVGGEWIAYVHPKTITALQAAL